MGAKLVIVHIEEPPLAYGTGDMYYGIADPDHGEVMRMLHRLVPADPEVSFEHRLLSGEPAVEIARLAEEEGMGLIVMGTHGRTGFKRLLMGSVAEAVVRRAPCPVLTFKPPRHVAVAAK
jgi:nucleotide-binding universal stress UspA family protein